jgi:hypothetical protein
MSKETQSELLAWQDELNWSTTEKYVAMLAEQNLLLRVENVDIDVKQLVHRRFTCDGHCCVQWNQKRAVIDRSCCSRYSIPVTSRDRRAIRERMDKIRPFLPTDHALQDPDASPFECDDEYGWDLVHNDQPNACQFSIYRDNKRLCALHYAALELGESPFEYKPIACSMWPLAIDDYSNSDGQRRILLTAYCADTADLFDSAEEEPFSCLIEHPADAPPLYQAERGTLELAFGEGWYKKLDRAAATLITEE